MKPSFIPSFTASMPMSSLYAIRTSIYFAMFAIVLALIYEGSLEKNLFHYVILGFSLIYPHIAQQLIRSTKGAKRNVRIAAYFLDVAYMGFMLAVVSFSPAPTMMALLVLNAVLVLSGGFRAFLTGNILVIVSAVTSALLLSATINENTSLLATLVSGGTLLISICLIAGEMFKMANRLDSVYKDIYKQKEESSRMTHMLSKYISPQVWQVIFSGEKDVKLESQRKKLSIFFSDIVEFSTISEEMEPEALTELLNQYLNEMSLIAMKYGGTIDKFIGDSVMVFFGDPTTQGAKKDALASVSMALEMRTQMRVLHQQWRNLGVTRPLQIRMGINTGYATVGNFGAESRMDYTIIGKEVNLASRLESASKAGHILISHETYSLIKDTILCRKIGDIEVKGFTQPVLTYVVVDFRRNLAGNNSYFEFQKDGFLINIDTDKIKNYDKENIISALEKTAKSLKENILI